ncbi:MAG: PAS domain-containing protein [Desulfobacteraceae bacterium]|nr:PAS domain-containing protein [Desulfobacteraceae bacterium]
MTEKQPQLHSLYEIALAIGNSFDLRKMVQEALIAYVAGLGCSAASAFETRKGPGEKVFFLPLVSTPLDNPLELAGFDRIPGSLTLATLSDFLRTLPLIGGDCDGHSFCLMELPGFGLLLLERDHSSFDPGFAKTLRRLNAKLAESCRICLLNDSTEQLNRNLIGEYFQYQRAEAGLKNGIHELEIKYRELFDNAVMGLFRIAPGGRIIDANPSFARILGYGSPEDLISSVSDFSRVYANPERRRQLLNQLDEFNSVCDFEIQISRKDRTTGWMAVNVRAVRDEHGTLISVEGTAEDITERKILESRLLQAQKMEAIGTLAGGIAHDFNNILSAIMGFAELSKLGITESKILGYMDQMLFACDKAKHLVRQILTFSRSGSQERNPVDLGTIVDESVRLLRAILPAYIEIRTEISPSSFAVLADRTEVHQILMNLCTNATHAMDETGGVISIELKDVDIAEDQKTTALKAGPYLRLSVSDTGVGIDPAILERIFDPFFTTKELGQGTGLGLSVVYGIVKSCGGTIIVESKPKAGSTFHVYLPAVSMPLIAGTDRLESLLGSPGAQSEEDAGSDPGAGTNETKDPEISGVWMPVMLGEVPAISAESIAGLENPYPDAVPDAQCAAGELLKIRPDILGILRTSFHGAARENNLQKLFIGNARLTAVPRNSAAMMRKLFSPTQ